MHKRPSLVISISILALLLVAAQALPATAVTPTRWGSKLTTNVQPQNFNRYCDDDGAPHPNCTWMFRHVFDRVGGEKAPKNGWIDKVRVDACFPGSFRLQLGKVRAKAGSPGDYEAKVNRNSGLISFDGDSDNCDDGVYEIDTINITDVWVNKGEYFGVKTKTPQALRCNSGSPNVLEFVPPLVPGGGFHDPLDTNGCDPLIELQYRP